jgi:hypothetical protein
VALQQPSAHVGCCAVRSQAAHPLHHLPPTGTQPAQTRTHAHVRSKAAALRARVHSKKSTHSPKEGYAFS